MKICSNCGAQNEDVFSKCVACGADLPITGDEATTVIEPLDAGNAPAENMQGAAQNQQYYGNAVNTQQFQQQPNVQGGMPYNNQAQGNWNEPVKSNKKGIFIALGIIAVVVVVALVLIFTVGGKAKGGAESPEAVAKLFIQAMDKKDTDAIVALCPPFLDPGKDDIQASLDMLNLYDSKLEYIDITEKEERDVKDIEEDIKDYYDVSVSIQEAYDLEVEYKMTMSYLGESYTEDTSEYMTVIKYKNKWFLYE